MIGSDAAGAGTTDGFQQEPSVSWRRRGEKKPWWVSKPEPPAGFYMEVERGIWDTGAWNPGQVQLEMESGRSQPTEGLQQHLELAGGGASCSGTETEGRVPGGNPGGLPEGGTASWAECLQEAVTIAEQSQSFEI